MSDPNPACGPGGPGCTLAGIVLLALLLAALVYLLVAVP